MSYSTFCVHMGGNIINSPRNIGLIRLKSGSPHVDNSEVEINSSTLA